VHDEGGGSGGTWTTGREEFIAGYNQDQISTVDFQNLRGAAEQRGKIRASGSEHCHQAEAEPPM
jgi:hypothetical protein